MNTTIERLKVCMVEHLKFVQSVENINDDAELTRLGLDSMAAINLMIDIEDEFGITFPDALLTPETFRTAMTLSSAIEEMMGGV
jgi:acyl carrier protein